MRSASPASRSLSWTSFVVSSTALRDLMKQIVRAPAPMRSVRMSAASASAERRGARSPSTSGGGPNAGLRRDAAQPAQDVPDVGAEHAPVHVRLVDDDDVEAVQEVRPDAVVGEDP